jgi:hypothetical protein
MIEKKLVEILDPVIEQLVSLEKRVDGIALSPGPAGADGKDGRDGVDGRDADHDAIAAHLKGDEAFRSSLKGEPGRDGKDGVDGVNGVDGRDADHDAIAAHLKGDEAFRSSLKGEPGRDGIDGKDGRDGVDGKDADHNAIAAQLKADDEFRAALKGDRGDVGASGRDGVDGKSVDVAEVVEAIIANHISEITGPAGEAGAPGTDGRDGVDGKDADAAEVAKHLARDEWFISIVTKTVEVNPWEPGIYREGKCVQHYIGRSYQAVCDTTEEPGDSPHWKRLGTAGQRDVGGFDESRSYEPGDIYHKDGSTFLFDGANHRLQVPKPVTERDVEKQLKGVRGAIAETAKAHSDKIYELQLLCDAQTAEIEDLKQQVAEVIALLKQVKP